MKIAPQFVTDPSTASLASGDGSSAIFLIAMTIALFVASLTLAPLVLQFGVKLVTKFKPSFKEAFFINLKIMVISFVGSFLLGLIVGASSSVVALRTGQEAIAPPSMPLLLLLLFPFQAWLYGRLVKVPESGPIGIGRGALVMLAQFLIVLAFVLGIMILVFMAGIVAGLAGH